MFRPYMPYGCPVQALQIALDGRVPYCKGKMSCGWQGNYNAEIGSISLCAALEEPVVSGSVFLFFFF